MAHRQDRPVPGTLPIGLNRISWKLWDVSCWKLKSGASLPIGLNRISWKLLNVRFKGFKHAPYRLG